MKTDALSMRENIIKGEYGYTYFFNSESSKVYIQLV